MLQSWTYSHCFTTIRTMFPLWHHFRKETHWNFGIPHSCADEGKADMESSPTSTWGWECWWGGSVRWGREARLLCLKPPQLPNVAKRSPIEPDLCPRSPSHGHKCQAPPSTRSHKRHMHPHQNAATRFWRCHTTMAEYKCLSRQFTPLPWDSKKWVFYPLLQGFGKPKTINKYYYHLKWQPKKNVYLYVHIYIDIKISLKWWSWSWRCCQVKKILFEQIGFSQDSEKIKRHLLHSLKN